MFSKTCLTTLLLVISAVADPVLVNRSPASLKLSRRLNLTSPHNLVRHDQARARLLKTRGAKSAGIPILNDAVINEAIDNQAVTYVAAVNVGSPATTFQLLIDTGSSNTWVGATTAYKKTSTSSQTSNKVSVTYGSGSFSGTEFTDQVSLATGLTIAKQSIGVASTSQGFQGVDGILGIGPVDLTLGTLSPATTTLIPTVTDNLFSAGAISAHSIAVSFEPSITGDDINGEITWGGTDSSKFTGVFEFLPLTKTAPASEFWGIDSSITYGSTVIMPTTAGIVDTGTTLLLLPTNAFNKYKTATGAVLDNNTGLLRVTSTQFNNLQDLIFPWETLACKFTPNAQLWPRSLNADIGGVAGQFLLIVNDLGSPSGEGLDFILGFALLERFYTVFDTANNQVGFALTPFTNANTN